MPAARKLTDEELERMRDLAAAGWSRQDLADAFEITPQHVGRLVREEQRPRVAGLDRDAVRYGVSTAVDEFLAGALLAAGHEVLAATARALASKLDAATASES